MAAVPSMVPAPQPGAPIVVLHAQAQQHPRKYEQYANTTSTGLGATQIILGILGIIFNSVAINLEGKNEAYSWNLSYCGGGIWAGLWFILTGAFGVLAGSRLSKCTIITFMVLSIISVSFFNVIFFGCAVPGAVVAKDNVYDCSGGTYGWKYNCKKNSGAYAMMLLLLIVCLSEFVVAIWSSVICCRAVCCGSRTSSVNPGAQAQYAWVQQAGGGQLVIVQNGVMVAPNAAHAPNAGQQQYLPPQHSPHIAAQHPPSQPAVGTDGVPEAAMYQTPPSGTGMEAPPQYSAVGHTRETESQMKH